MQLPDAGLLSPSELQAQILQSLRLSGRTVLVLPDLKKKPLRVLIGGLGDEEPVILRIYAWNITHGGGAARAIDEYRIQLTGDMPIVVAGEVTIVLGWSTKFRVFAGWDSNVHNQRRTASPSLQVRQGTLESATKDGLAAAVRESDDIVVAFRAELLTTYCLNAEVLHSDTAVDIATLLNAIPAAINDGESPADAMPIGPRKRVARIVESNVRAWDFGTRVQRAYQGRCAICAMQLSLTEAAHIVPVAWVGSTDETSNGMSLCRNHHRAYDANLLSVDPDYKIEISLARADALGQEALTGGLEELLTFSGEQIAVIPAALSDRPKPEYLKIGRDARQWQP